MLISAEIFSRDLGSEFILKPSELIKNESFTRRLYLSNSSFNLFRISFFLSSKSRILFLKVVSFQLLGDFPRTIMIIC